MGQVTHAFEVGAGGTGQAPLFAYPHINHTENLIGIVVSVHRQTNLLEVVAALGPRSGFANLLNGGQRAGLSGWR